MSWVGAISRLHRDNRPHVLVTVLEVVGSAPRDVGTKMVVDADAIHETVGGGNLEFEAIRQARQLLQSGHAETVTRTFTLGNDLAQCCGGKVTLLFESFPACDFNIVLFGAGHVGKALVQVLSALPCRVHWFDSRPREFPADLADNVLTGAMDNPFEAVEKAPPGAWYLVMTHSHESDLEICEAVLTRGDSRYCGLIGSRSKGVKFRRRLQQKGFTDEELARLTSPIGLPGVGGKAPMEVAVSVIAQLLQQRNEISDAQSDDNVVNLDPRS